MVPRIKKMKNQPTKKLSKGVILAGGSGTRLRPATLTQNKHLLPVINFPMILFPLHTLKNMGVTDVLIISGGNHIGGFAEFLGDGSSYGVSLTYRVQKDPAGIAGALLLAEDFVDGEELFAVILGDNFFDGDFSPEDIYTPTLFVSYVPDAKRFGVYDEEHYTITEKPNIEGGGLAVTGLYVYDQLAFEYAESLTPSTRGEYEITDVNNAYLKSSREVRVRKIDSYWSDMGTPESLIRTSQYLVNKPFVP
jgi:glucose-1-phosphate thymidylyltransferase